MKRSHAAVLLGISENATLTESRKAYLTRARLLHPDRLVGGTQDEIATANRAMAQLNEAYEVMQKPPSEATYETRSQDVPPPDNFGFPIWSDGNRSCDLCGWGPAAKVKFNSVSGFVIFMRWYTFDARMCKLCARAMYDENQRNTLTRGWWGIFSFFATLFAFVSNMAALSKTRSLGNPQGRYPGAYTISPVPLAISRQWWKRPSALIASAVALSVVALIGIGAATPTSSSQSPSTNQQNTGTMYDLQGACLSEDSTGGFAEASCDSSSADWIITNVLSTAAFTSNDCMSTDYLFAGENGEYIICIDEY